MLNKKGQKGFSLTLESLYAISMSLLFGITFIAMLIICSVLLYDAYIFWKIGKETTEYSWFSWIIGIIILFSFLWSLLRSKQEGILLKKEDTPKLFDLVDKAIKKTGIHPIDKIYLLPNTTIAVSGFFSKKLLMGLGTLRYITDKDFEAILYHEIGHFAAKDTKSGSLLNVFFAFIEKQYRTSVNWWNYSPSLYISLLALPTLTFSWIFLHISTFLYAPYSKYREYKADEFAASHCSPKVFTNALAHYSAYSLAYETIMADTVLQLLVRGHKVLNVYAEMTHNWTEENFKISMNNVLSAQESYLGTHPSTSKRLQNLGVDGVGSNKGNLMSSYFPKLEKLETKLSDEYTLKVGKMYGLLDKNLEEI